MCHSIVARLIAISSSRIVEINQKLWSDNGGGVYIAHQHFLVQYHRTGGVIVNSYVIVSCAYHGINQQFAFVPNIKYGI